MKELIRTFDLERVKARGAMRVVAKHWGELHEGHALNVVVFEEQGAERRDHHPGERRIEMPLRGGRKPSWESRL